MNKILLIVLTGYLLFTNVGCVSYMAKQSWNDAKEQQAVRVEADGTAVMVGVDLTAMEYLSDNWPIALGAAVLDAGLLYGTYLAVDEISNSSDSDDEDKRGDSDAGRDNIYISLEGDGNDIQVKGDTSTIGTPSPSPVIP